MERKRAVLGEEIGGHQQYNRWRIFSILHISDLDPAGDAAIDLGHLYGAARRYDLTRNTVPIAAILFATIVGWTALAQPSNPVTLSIATDTPTATTGEEIRLNILIKNVSSGPADIYTASGSGDGRADLDYSISVRDGSGAPLPRIDAKKRVLPSGRIIVIHNEGFNRKKRTLEPGEQRLDFAILNHLFDLSRAGTYTVEVKKDIPIDGTRPETKLESISSNTITITVIP